MKCQWKRLSKKHKKVAYDYFQWPSFLVSAMYAENVNSVSQESFLVVYDTVVNKAFLMYIFNLKVAS